MSFLSGQRNYPYKAGVCRLVERDSVVVANSG